MSQPWKWNKRIVSKTEYVAFLLTKVTLTVLGSLLSVWAIIGGCLLGFCLLCTIPLMWVVQWRDDPGTNLASIGIGVGVCLFISILCLLLYRLGDRISYKANTMEKIPMPRANTYDLPASESLVRASSEPKEEQESILLRASLQSQQTPAEQLLRSVKE